MGIIRLEKLGTYAAGAYDEGAAEIVAHDPATQRLFVVNGATGRVDVLSISDPEVPVKLFDIDLSALGESATSVAVKNGVLAVAVVNPDPLGAGKVGFFDTTTGDLLNAVDVGVLPDMVTFTPDGTKVLTANEGEPADGGDPEGSVSIINIAGGVAAATVATVGFSAFNGREEDLRADGVRIFPGKSAAQDFEPEYIAVSPDGNVAFITLQEANAFAVLNLQTNTFSDIIPLGLKDHSSGAPALTEYDFDDRPALGTTDTGIEIKLGGLSSLFYQGTDPVTGNLKFVTVPDRGPNGEPLNTDGDAELERPFLLPEYQARVVHFELDRESGEITVTNTVLLTRWDGVTPITGLPNIPGVDEEPVELQADGTTYAPLPYDALGADLEGVIVANDGTYWMVDEYRPAIYHFAADGKLINRFVPEGTAALGNQIAGSFGLETLPGEYATRIANRGFEAMAYDAENNVIYAFIQTPLANPSAGASSSSSVIRMLGIDAATGEPVSEYVYLLEKPTFRDATVDKIGDAEYIGDGKFVVVDRDSSLNETAKKYVYEIDIKGATNLLDLPPGTLPAGETLEQQTADDLAALGIEPVHKVKVLNLPSIGYLPNDKVEGITVLEDGSYVVLNDNDFGVGGSDAVSLGIVEFGSNYGLDPSDRDGPSNSTSIKIGNWPVFGMFMPDAIASFQSGGATYYVTANEGDTRDENARISTLNLDPDAYPNAAQLKTNAQLGRLDASSIDGDIDGDGDIDQIQTYGTRSFTVWDARGNLVFDSGDIIEQVTAALFPTEFNSDNSENDSRDTRSDNKGPEPEGVAVGEVDGRTYAFVGLERIGGVMVFDVTDAKAPQFIQYVNPRDFAGDAEAGTAGDLGPEGITFIKAEDSPTGRPMLAVGNEVSGTTTLYDILPSESTLTIMEIQGESHDSPVNGAKVTTSGIVTAVASNGFYLQDPTGDDNVATSDAIFVFTSTAPAVAVGDAIDVTGLVSEFVPGGFGSGNLPITQIVSPSIEVVSSGNALPAATIIGAGGRVPPGQVIDDDNLSSFDPETDGVDFYESLESMRVQVNDAVVVGPTNSFGEIAIVANNGADAGTRTANGGIVVQPGDFNPERIIIDDALFSAEPAVKAGDVFTAPVTGVLSYSFGNYKLLNTEALPSVTPSSITPETTSLIGNADQLTVATFNVLNLNPNVGDPDPANNDRLDRLAKQIVQNLKAPDIIGLEEMQDNNGTTNNGVVAGDQTFQELIDAIIAQGGPTYEFRQIDPVDNQDGGAPGANIRVGFLFNPERVSFIDRPGGSSTTETEVVAGEDGPELSQSPGRLGVDDPAFNADEESGTEGARKPLAAEFEFNGEKVFVILNHLKSKSGDQALFGDNQPPVQLTEAQRIAEAELLNDFVEDILGADPDAKVIVMGDMNDFDFSNALAALKGDDLTNLIENVPLNERYSFIFDGNSQVLDHILVSDSLVDAGAAQVDIVHANVDFPAAGQTSDHDAVVARFFIPEAHPEDSVRFATFNASLNRNAAGQLVTDLSTPDNAQAQTVAEIIQRVAPDVLLINEFDYVPGGTALDLFQQNYLNVGQNGVAPVEYQYSFVAPSNTGIASGFDLDNNGSVGGGNDAFGFGNFEGQFGMAFFSNYEILTDQVRTFQTFLWKDMPGALLPDDPNTAEPNDWYSAEELAVFRLSSKSHWDIPILVDGEVIHVLVAHPTPPTFDGAEDRNGLRNHDEIRFWADYVSGDGDYIYDDEGDFGGLEAGARFVIMGDYNADPNDGDSFDDAINQFLDNPLIDDSLPPSSEGAVEQSALQGGANTTHTGDPQFDTADFADGAPGNLRVDYVLPSESGLDPVGSGVFWPTTDEPTFDLVGTFPFPSSDHRLVYTDVVVTEPTSTTFKLQILHASDLEGGVQAIARAANFAAIIDYLEDTVANSITLSAGDNYISGPFFNAAGDPTVRDELQSVNLDLFGPAGAGITSSYREAGGRIDISIMNAVGFDASALGNHEFDLGTTVIREIIGTDLRDTGADADTLPNEIRWLGANFPYLSSNLDFSADPNLASLFTSAILPNTAFQTTNDEIQTQAGLAAEAAAPKIAQATIIEEGGEKIGVVGATTPLLGNISSPGATEIKDPGAGTNDMAALASILQPVIDAVIAQGVNKVVLVTHLQQIQLEQQLVPLLHGVDVVIAGGSDTRLADQEDVARGLQPGDTPDGDYPIVATNADGDPTIIVSTDGEYSYVGRLVVEFDQDGKVIVDSIDENVSGAFASTDEQVAALWGNEDPFAEGTKGDLVQTLTDAVESVVIAKDGNILGQTDVFLNGRRADVRTEETNLGNLTADANLAVAKQFDPTVLVSIKNGGGIRDVIGAVVETSPGVYEEVPPLANPVAGKEAGDISQLDVENSLRFNNLLSLVTVTAAQLAQVVEHGVAASADGATPGQFPQVGGIEFSFDNDLPAGNRVQSLVIRNEAGDIVDVILRDGELQGDPDRAIRVVTLNFLLTGGDSYPFQSFINANPAFANRVDLNTVLPAGGAATFAQAGSEQDAFAEFLAANFASTPYNEADTDPTDDTRIQNLDFRDDTVLRGSNVFGPGGDDALNGTGGDDTIRGQGGEDTVLGLAGDDSLDGGSANDAIQGGDGDDTAVGGPGDDLVDGGNGADSLDGGSGNDTVDAGAGDDQIRGASGDDEITGGEGNDAVDGSTGNDTVFGGDGNDALKGGSGDDSLEGGDGDDVATGSSGNDTMVGGEGNDIFNAGSGDDVVAGDDGDDFLTTGSGADLVEGGAGNDTIEGGGDNDSLIGSEGNDIVTAASGNDLVMGGEGNDLLQGNTGDDTMFGDGGEDVIFTGSGLDVIVVDVGTGIDMVGDFQIGADLLDLSAFGFADAAAARAVAAQVGTDIVFDLPDEDQVVLLGLNLDNLQNSSLVV